MKRSPLNPVSPKRRKRMASYAQARQEVLERSGGRCEARCCDDCNGRLELVHHKRRRSQGGTDDLSNLLGLDNACHDHIHANPSWAMDAGYLIGNEPLSSAVTRVERIR